MSPLVVSAERVEAVVEVSRVAKAPMPVVAFKSMVEAVTSAVASAPDSSMEPAAVKVAVLPVASTLSTRRFPEVVVRVMSPEPPAVTLEAVI